MILNLLVFYGNYYDSELSVNFDKRYFEAPPDGKVISGKQQTVYLINIEEIIQSKDQKPPKPFFCSVTFLPLRHLNSVC